MDVGIYFEKSVQKYLDTIAHQGFWIKNLELFHFSTMYGGMQWHKKFLSYIKYKPVLLTIHSKELYTNY